MAPLAKHLLPTLAVLLLAGCASSSLPVERIEAARCSVDGRLTGTWKSYRTSQVGPTWMRFTFGCDCTYSSRVQLLWMRISERGTYHFEDGAIVTERPEGETTRLPFTLEDERLLLEEAPGEEHAYRQVRHLDCGAPP